MRRTQMSSTVFIKCQEKYLFLLRSADKSVDANRLNGIGGKVDPGENYLETALRETLEETGYQVGADQTRFVGITQLQGGYADDWIAAFFVIEVDSPEVPLGFDTPDGKLMWLAPDEVLRSEYELVDDLHYLWPEILAGRQFFLSAQVNNEEKIETFSLSSLDRA